VPGSSDTRVGGINNAGQIAGSYFDASGLYGFLLSGGRNTAFAPPGAIDTFGNAINSAGQIVGTYQTVFGGPTAGFLLSGGSYNRLVVPGSTETYGLGINDSGQIVGIYQNGGPHDPSHGFLLSGGNYTTINGPPGSVLSSGAYAINNAGQILVESSLGSFLLSGGAYTPISVPRISGLSPTGINDADKIVGFYSDPSLGKTVGFLLSDGVLTTLDIPGSVSVGATDINDAGQIVGTYTLADGTYHGFLATPTPEPTTFVLLSIGIIALIGWAWLRASYGVRTQRTPWGSG
jgi:probable HAF family extracellular repeat protein